MPRKEIQPHARAHTHTHTHVHACTPCPFLISNPDSSTQTTKVRSVRATPSKTHDYRRLVALGTPEVYMGQGKPLFPGLLRRSAALIATFLVAPTEITHNGRLLRGPHQQEASGARRHLDASPASAGTPPGPTRVDPQEKSGGSETGALLRSALRSSLFPGLGNRTPSGSAGWAGREGEVNKVEEEDCLGTARC